MKDRCDPDTNFKKKNTTNISQLPSSSIQDILPPFPVVKNPDNLIITFDVNFKTKISNLEYLIFYFQDRFY